MLLLTLSFHFENCEVFIGHLVLLEANVGEFTAQAQRRLQIMAMFVGNSERIWTLPYVRSAVSNGHGVEGGSRKIAQGTAAAVQGAKDCNSPPLNLGRDYW